MKNEIDLVDLAQELAGIAGSTADPKTARLLLALIERLLRAAGLPPGAAG